ncbi:lysylphosphatidylglycerol synthase transmembrane domain-containing protein [Halospina sp. K52047b]|uniref:lysylphosphatidylglycerol synthase transmembrane domain-containing protein n=1 Tax=Halospina sp. K52047b TaxID=2614160 RepID=UPI001787D421|nr:lysylphosphatidylglycerol synthase transmembrane domain-containing protein [Halospina sp. K52047b]
MKRYGRLVVSLALLGVVAMTIKPAEVVTVLQRLPPWSLVAALALSIPQVVLSALRWRYTAYRLDLPLGAGESVAAYYRATLVNQIMPGGVVGDVERAWRARHPEARTSAAAHSVMIERLSGQLALVLTITALLVIAPPFALPGPQLSGQWLWGAALVLLLAIAAGRLPRVRDYSALLRADVHTALFRWPAPVIQLALSLAVVATYFATLALLDASIATQPLTPEKLALHACLLLSMVLPVSIAGWGVREGVAAALWPLAGLPANEGVALSIAYGVVILLGGLPGLIPVPGGKPRSA